MVHSTYIGLRDHFRLGGGGEGAGRTTYFARILYPCPKTKSNMFGQFIFVAHCHGGGGGGCLEEENTTLF